MAQQNTSLEPRVATLEAGLSRLTDDVRDLAGLVRNQTTAIEDQINKLSIAVTQASGPKKTDWSTIIAGVMLIMAIMSAVFWPLNQKQDYTQGQIDKMTTKFEHHILTDESAVFETRLHKLEEIQLNKEKSDSDELSAWRQKAMGVRK